ncbi:2,3-dihydro-2,3-dihydroxybenzoate dehydrogenase [Guyparkeria halophila]|uniref:2,3-dihydro-2,3-dihydroxybenzoate dehydrogenase n=1 Tax=Guyparkeria halophila TaxID=47960 RepID=A0ABZ0YZP3_9GAMM|nr:2,3-dihydro-2,3-dihydroxybenzoate dehydrogenase [Guyparkeria halophila]WQH16676.1 2,3-dihydro-2,3-dihydroxybenzoate dehydrogenase [Guyparkeria halophila]
MSDRRPDAADSADEDEWRGRRVWVTGAGRGIGRAVAQRFQALGCAVVGFDRHFDEADEPDEPGLRRVTLDVSNSAAVDATSRKLIEQAAGVDVLVNVAGVLRPGPLESMADADWRQTFDVNVTGAFHLLRAVSPVFRRQGHGCVVAVSSNAARVPRVGMAAYGASKAALTSLTLSTGLELASSNVRCNVVSPGSTRTPMLESLWDDGLGERTTIAGDPERYRLGIPLGRLGQPEDVVEAVVFLASSRARHITLQDLVVDGGATLGA